MMVLLFILVNACYGLPCHNGGSCSVESTTKGYRCHCPSFLDPATDCLTGVIISQERQISERFFSLCL